ncbi:amino acid/amide ABC transporter substrate-binding protein, HAAT family [Chitinophaga costaii]|uniref:Amino acid/amide ABC transporter substrate-binding protein, HAAT family n=1 Tax=Chitinophaga costaii TaxID=1335309 RepID=A0A1C4E073_9BACT|nr:ABC transporter substrate-binding protein [Chitinophaga costaii]PUZ24393.1 hypothetical protein DCM91_13290 [Chitinophaga costaii]SCC37033.1 amino acid/amide ABC transporter substrate-binding protein, HAAT family [Chitinophaga costaii]
MRPLKIGFLTPYSGIYPFYSAHLVLGWLLGMGLDPIRQRSVVICPEYTHQGGLQATLQAARKLLFFDQVDLLSGLISYKSMTDLVPMVESHRKTAFLFDMGEYVPHFPYLSPDIFYASHQLWQSEYALGYWAQQHYGDGGHLIMPVYEAGYHFANTFQQGIVAAGGANLHKTILPFDEQRPQAMNLDPIFYALEKQAPPYVHAIFCGDMGNQFLVEWAQRGMHKKFPLLLNETMAYDDILQDVQHINMELYTAMMWNRDDESKENQQFVKTFEKAGQQPANIFGLMGYEAGLLWKELLTPARKGDWDTVKKALRADTIKGPRGEKNFYPLSGFALPQADIMKINITQHKIHKIIVDQGKGMHFNAPVFEAIHQECVSGWQNPFLCV